jgi:hypothetical protein
MVDEVIRRTTVIPGVLSVDDGYASAANVERDEGPQDSVISIQGPRPARDWKQARVRSGPRPAPARSLMFTLKRGRLREVARRGL